MHTPEKGLEWIERDYVLLAVDANQNIGGFVSVGKCAVPFGQVTTRDGEIKKMYVDQKYFGTGLAHILFKKGFEWVNQTFPGNIYISSFSGNDRAFKFYQKQGFELVGTCKYPVGNTEDLDYREAAYPGQIINKRRPAYTGDIMNKRDPGQIVNKRAPAYCAIPPCDGFYEKRSAAFCPFPPCPADDN
ncbi:hypothetical protein HDV01_005838 [Terramyces sp. JEL0728]|nr:hypothetical protein HDV01_005838 [Terramyces sp. JEL0728]